LPPSLPLEKFQDHWFDLETGAQPTARTQWRLTQPELQELWDQLDYLLAKGFVRASMSLFAAPILFTPKKDGGLRIHDYMGSLLREGGNRRIWVPSYHLLREFRIQEVHDSNLSGYFGVDKTLKALQWFYYWPDMIPDVQKYVGVCLTTHTLKSSRQRSAGLLQPLEPPKRPWQHVTMDFVTGLPARPTGNDAALKPRICSSRPSFACMVSLRRSSATETQNSPRASGKLRGTVTALAYSSHPPITRKPTVRQNGRIGPWNSLFARTSRISANWKICYPCSSFPTTTHPLPRPITCHFS
ncbi:hypothetical protein CLOP_g21721, partial [Closterium sp. NIES-67]